MSYYSHRARPQGGLSLKGIVKGAVKIGGGLLTGGPIGAAKAAGQLVASNLSRGQSVSPAQLGTIQGGVVVPTKIDIARGVAQMIPGPLGRIAEYAMGSGGRRPGRAEMVNGQCPKGYHPNKQDGKYGAAGTYCVVNRRINFSNGRAIGRANRRIRGGIKMFKQSLSIVGTSLKGKRVVPRRKR